MPFGVSRLLVSPVPGLEYSGRKEAQAPSPVPQTLTSWSPPPSLHLAGFSHTLGPGFSALLRGKIGENLPRTGLSWAQVRSGHQHLLCGSAGRSCCPHTLLWLNPFRKSPRGSPRWDVHLRGQPANVSSTGDTELWPPPCGPFSPNSICAARGHRPPSQAALGSQDTSLAMTLTGPWLHLFVL